MKGLQSWLTTNLCEGRSMKAPAPDMDIAKIVRAEPKVYIGWYPRRPDQTLARSEAPINVCPGILIMPNASKVRDMEEKRFDRYNGVHRPRELGQTLSVSMLFSVYEQGIRKPGFIQDTSRMDLIEEGTEEGLFTLTDWMDECIMKLLGTQLIPNTDLYLNDTNSVYSLYTDQSYVVDRRPIFYGFINAEFGCYAEDGLNSNINKMLL